MELYSHGPLERSTKTMFGLVVLALAWLGSIVPLSLLLFLLTGTSPVGCGRMPELGGMVWMAALWIWLASGPVGVVVFLRSSIKKGGDESRRKTEEPIRLFRSRRGTETGNNPAEQDDPRT